MPRRSSPRPLVLDTNTFNDAGFLHFLRDYPKPTTLPAVALMELARIHHARGRPASHLLSFLAARRIDVEPFAEAQAIDAAYRDIPDATWQKHLADHMIAAHVHGDRVLVTRNLGHFASLGDAVLAPETVMRRWR